MANAPDSPSPRFTALLALSVPGLFLVGFGLLTRLLDYPAVLEQPGGVVLSRVAGAGPVVGACWYAVMFAGLLQIPLSLWMHRWLARPDTGYLAAATCFGVLAGLTQFLDSSQWVYLVPRLAAGYVQPGTSEATKEALVVAYQAFQDWVGVAIGRYLATVASGAWALGVGAAMVRAPGLRPWLGGMGVLSGVAFLVSILQPFGFAFWAFVNTAGFGLWVLWLWATAVALLRAGRPPASGPSSAAHAP
jgi:hypothetical protein